MPRLALQLLGAFAVRLDDQPVTAFETDKTRALLAYLAIESAAPQRRDRLAGLLWPDRPEAAARRSLSQALFNLRRVIGDDAALPFFQATREAIQFNPASDHVVDVIEFEAAVRRAAAHHHDAGVCSACVAQLQRAAEWYRGELLPAFSIADSTVFEDWLLLKRESVRQQALGALAQLTAHYAQQRNVEAALRYARRQLELDPWREEAHQQAMRALWQAGRRSEALAQYDACKRALADQLGVEPSPETQALHNQIRSTTNGEARKADLRMKPLPTSLTAFVGRERELEQLSQLSAQPGCRLITLVGPGGVGKSRLAVHFAASQRHRFTDGVIFVPLVGAASGAAIIPALADSLGFAFYGPIDPRVQLFNYLRHRQCLIVLDNLEQLLGDPDTIDLLSELLAAAPHCVLIATSREDLRVQAEWLFEVKGLSTPAPGAAVEDSEAVQLFVQQARRVRGGLDLRGSDLAEIARICRSVEGLPLAIELAASWLRTLTCAEIAQEIDRDVNFLATSARDVPPRHRSIRAVVDHSWQLLTDEERRGLRRLAVFRGGFTREAAAQIAGASIGLLSALVAKSLTRRTLDGRYDLHELVRQYAETHLRADADEFDAVNDRHAAYYSALLDQSSTKILGPQQVETLALLTTEINNLRAAWEWSVGRARWLNMIKASQGWVWLCERKNWYQEGQALFARAAAALQDRAVEPIVQAALAEALTGEGVFTYRRSQNDRARDILTQAAALLRPLIDAVTIDAQLPLWEVIGCALFYRGVACFVTGQYPLALQSFSEGYDIATARGGRLFSAGCAIGLGIMKQGMGQLDEALRYMEDGVAKFRSLGDPALLAWALGYASATQRVAGRVAEARRMLLEGLTLSRAIGDQWSEATALNFLGALDYALKDYERAIEHLDSSAQLFKHIGQAWNYSRALKDLAFAYDGRGDTLRANDCFLEALRVAMSAQILNIATEALLGLALLRGRAGEVDRACEWLTLVIDHVASTQETKERAAALRENLAAQLTPDRLAAAQTRARTTSFVAVVDEVLGVTAI